jgi:hypothetical protein
MDAAVEITNALIKGTTRLTIFLITYLPRLVIRLIRPRASARTPKASRKALTEDARLNGCRDVVVQFANAYGYIARECMSREELEAKIDFPIGGFSPPEGRLARGFKPPAFSRFLFQSAVKSAESF